MGACVQKQSMYHIKLYSKKQAETQEHFMGVIPAHTCANMEYYVITTELGGLRYVTKDGKEILIEGVHYALTTPGSVIDNK